MNNRFRQDSWLGAITIVAMPRFAAHSGSLHAFSIRPIVVRPADKYSVKPSEPSAVKRPPPSWGDRYRGDLERFDGAEALLFI
jgi:hypothetical protein